jgi:hypothetical protein
LGKAVSASGAGFGLRFDLGGDGGDGEAALSDLVDEGGLFFASMFHTADTKLAISLSEAVDVSKKLALVTLTSEGDLDEWFEDGGLDSLALPMEAPLICRKGSSSLLLESTICATLTSSTPANFWIATTVAR